jgi:hypothetical protein
VLVALFPRRELVLAAFDGEVVDPLGHPSLPGAFEVVKLTDDGASEVGGLVPAFGVGYLGVRFGGDRVHDGALFQVEPHLVHRFQSGVQGLVEFVGVGAEVAGEPGEVVAVLRVGQQHDLLGG